MLKYRNLAPLGATLIALAFMKPYSLMCQSAANPALVAQDSLAYALDSSSLLLVHAGKSGLLKGFGHEHQVRAHAFSGTLWYFPNDVGRSRVRITVLTSGLRVVAEADSADIPEISKTMRERTLRVDSFPEIEFVSREVALIGAAGGAGAAGAAGAAEPQTIRVTGDLTMVGVTRPVSLDLTLDVSADTLRAYGELVVKQTDFGIKPYSKALGLVKVKNEVRFELRVVAVR